MSVSNRTLLASALACAVILAARGAVAQEKADPQLAAFINTIKAIDDHSHALPVATPAALDRDVPDPLGTSVPFMSVRQRETNPEWIDAWRALDEYPWTDTTPDHLQAALREFTRMNIAPIILHKKFEDLREAPSLFRSSSGILNQRAS